jgi:hypothetical protein
MSIPEERILQLAGLDAYMLLRFIRLCLKVRQLASGPWSLIESTSLSPTHPHFDPSPPFAEPIDTKPTPLGGCVPKLQICLASGFFGLVILVPLYLHGNRDKPYDGKLRTIMDDPKVISMGNIKVMDALV